jgi:ABC-2 type transport system ATP-binding protein
MTGRENLEMAARLFGLDRRTAKQNAARALDQLGLVTKDAHRLVRTYSGGMRRKVDLAASLVGAPRLLLLDEPTTGLDPRSRIELWEAIRSLVEQGTDVLLTTQYLDEADHLASRIVIIDRGRVVAAGTSKELKSRIGRNVIEVHVRRTEDLTPVARVLSAPHNGAPRIEEATRRVTVSVEAGIGRLRTVLEALETAGLEVDDVSLRTPSLDEVFLALTGRLVDEKGAE